MKRAFVLAFAVTFAGALVLALRGGWPIVLLGALCIACGILYTGGPYPLGYHGLGDVFAFIFFGPVAVGATYYLQAHALTWPVVVAGAAPGLFAVALITVNNLRDIGSDRQAGKRTLAVRLGRHFARCEYVVTVLLALALPPLLWRVAGLGSAWTLLPLASLALAVPAMVMVWRHTDGPTLNRALAMTGQLELLFSLLYAAGLVL